MKKVRIVLLSILAGLTGTAPCWVPFVPWPVAPHAIEQIVVPDLVGGSLDEAHDQLEAEGLKASATNIYGEGDWPDDGVVLTILPVAGSRVRPGTTIAVSAATKTELAFYTKPMPDLRGSMPPDNLSDPLTHLRIKYTYRAVRDREKLGSIVAQKPKPGTHMKLGAQITLTVADYKPTDSGGGSDYPDLRVPDVNWPNPCRHTKWC
ncbi:PASTA domain-containing protein [Actinoplanes sp. TFC3]|uniref:PASTA domain-containing protein n=1 Tax=Actinoplanes sp. TFC3 TaxID=1710355 RepID=UPI0013794182|nr:PASTA domain-containing protein [Actinoplanes sp. TFC3]